MKNIALMLIAGAILIVPVLAGCAVEPPPAPAVTAATPVPTVNPALLCAEIDSAWGLDWARVIDGLRTLRRIDRICPDAAPSGERLYTAHLIYGAILEATGDTQAAVSQYTAAQALNLLDTSAAESRLLTLHTEPTAAPDCDAQPVTLPDYAATLPGAFVTLADNALTLEGKPYPIYGVNYYPRDTPEQRFLQQTNLDTVGLELDLIAGAGFNTLRIFLRHEQLFICGDVPRASAFTLLDGVIQAAGQRNLRVIPVLFHAAGTPPFLTPEVSRMQAAFLARRYADEGAILAYDLRDRGDDDYAANPLQRESVLLWLADTVGSIRRAAPQLITAGWDDDSAVTAPIVDFVSFQNFAPLDDLRQEIAVVTDRTQKPIVLSAFGYDTMTYDEIGQRQAYQRALEAVNANDLAGWIAWTAFDYPLTALCMEPECPAERSPAHQFGLWNSGYFPHLALDAILAVTGN